MKKMLLLSLVCMTSYSCTNNVVRQITVEATHEEEIAPDKAILVLELSEYWREELVPGTRYDDYQNRGPTLEDIEKNAVKILSDAGMPPDSLTVIDSGTKYRPNSGRDLLTYRRYKINLSNLGLIQPLLASLRGPEVSYFRLDQLTHSDIEGLKAMAGKKALDSAYAKAKIIVADHDEIGQLLTVQEGNVQLSMPIVGPMPRAMTYQAAPAAVTDDASEVGYNKIKVSATVQASFKFR